MPTVISASIQLKRDTKANWNISTLPIKDGEIALATDQIPVELRIGVPGNKTWSQLPATFLGGISAITVNGNVIPVVNGTASIDSTYLSASYAATAGTVVTASRAISASIADAIPWNRLSPPSNAAAVPTASYALVAAATAGVMESASFSEYAKTAGTASRCSGTASYALSAGSAITAATASRIPWSGITGIPTATVAVASSSFATQAGSASYAATAATASTVTGGLDYVPTSWTGSATASMAGTASYALVAGTAMGAVADYAEYAGRIGDDAEHTYGAGSNVQFIYFYHGLPVPSSANIGNSSTPIYLDGGQFKAASSIPAAPVQSDWSVTNTTSLAYIKNKPTIPASPVQSDWNVTDSTSLAYIKNKPTELGVQSNWNESSTTSLAYIQNKPPITYSSNTTTIGSNTQVNGNLNVTGDVVAAYTSDRRLKENIQAISGAEADKVLQELRPVEFTWNKTAQDLSDGHKTGKARSFLADEFLAVLSNAGQKVWKQYDAIDIVQVIPYLVAGYKRQQQQIQDLEARLARLESQD